MCGIGIEILNVIDIRHINNAQSVTAFSQPRLKLKLEGPELGCQHLKYTIPSLSCVSEVKKVDAAELQPAGREIYGWDI